MNFRSAMPAATQRAHFKPSWRGDRLAAIAAVARRPLGRDHIRAIDMNFQWAWNALGQPGKGGEGFNIHWGKPIQNNYRFILPTSTAKRARRMTRAELRRPITKWTAGQVARWRRGPHPASARPCTYYECAAYAQRRGVVVCAEVKTPAFAREVPMKHMVDAARRANHPPFFMALREMGGVAKAEQAARQGGWGAVIHGKFKGRRNASRRQINGQPPAIRNRIRIW